MGAAVAADAAPSVPGLRRSRQSADLAPQGDLPAKRPPLHAFFARLTAQEEKHGLLDDPATIGTRDSWHRRLAAAGIPFRGHRRREVERARTCCVPFRSR